MIITRHRTHKVNVGNYENVEFGASITVDWPDNDMDLDSGPVIEYLNRRLDLLLQEDMDEAIANVPEGDSTYAEFWRK